MFSLSKRDSAPRIGLLLAGILGNNGSTLWMMHKLARNREPMLGSLFAQSDIPIIGEDRSRRNLAEILKAQHQICCLQDVIAISGWDTYSDSIYNAVKKNKIVPEAILEEVAQAHPEDIHKPVSVGIVYPDFIGLPVNLSTQGTATKDVDRIKQEIDAFSALHNLEFVIVFYSGSTEKATCGWDDISPSEVYAIATACANTETCFINCGAQDTLTLSVQSIFSSRGKFAIGNDLQTGQTRLKSELLGMFLGHGIPVCRITNLNYLGNRDGFNLCNVETNLSKTKSKSSMISAVQVQAPTLYTHTNRAIDHHVHISYVPSVGDDKRGMDEYCLDFPFQKQMTMYINCTYPDTLLAVGVMHDLLLASSVLMQVRVKENSKNLTQAEGDSSSSSFSMEGKENKLTVNQANALVACLMKNPQTTKGRFTLAENRDVLTGFFLELFGFKPETMRHWSIFLE